MKRLQPLSPSKPLSRLVKKIKITLLLFTCFAIGAVNLSSAQVAMMMGHCNETQMKDDRNSFIQEFDDAGNESKQLKGLYYSKGKLFKDARYSTYYVHRFSEDGSVVSMAIIEVNEKGRIRSVDEVVGLLARSNNQEQVGEGSYLVKDDMIEIRLVDKDGQETLYWGKVDEKGMELTVHKEAVDYCDGLDMDKYIRSGP